MHVRRKSGILPKLFDKLALKDMLHLDNRPNTAYFTN
jgi:hypothetical protein